MESLTRLAALAAPLPEADVDTDIIFPARFLLITSKTGLGRYAFYERRYDADGAPRASFVLNRPEYAGAQILVTGDNFGGGSSREHAVWALHDMGFRAVIAPRFGEIFAANCLKNGMAPVTLPAPAVASLMDDAREGRPVTVDVAEQAVVAASGERFAFALPPAAREALLNGWDEVEVLLNAHAAEITAFETRQRAERPWLYVQD